MPAEANPTLTEGAAPRLTPPGKRNFRAKSTYCAAADLALPYSPNPAADLNRPEPTAPRLTRCLLNPNRPLWLSLQEQRAADFAREVEIIEYNRI
jgi:hypothetical protein